MVDGTVSANWLVQWYLHVELKKRLRSMYLTHSVYERRGYVKTNRFRLRVCAV